MRFLRKTELKLFPFNYRYFEDDKVVIAQKDNNDKVQTNNQIVRLLFKPICKIKRW